MKVIFPRPVCLAAQRRDSVLFARLCAQAKRACAVCLRTEREFCMILTKRVSLWACGGSREGENTGRPEAPAASTVHSWNQEIKKLLLKKKLLMLIQETHDKKVT